MPRADLTTPGMRLIVWKTPGIWPEISEGQRVGSKPSKRAAGDVLSFDAGVGQQPIVKIPEPPDVAVDADALEDARGEFMQHFPSPSGCNGPAANDVASGAWNAPMVECRRTISTAALPNSGVLPTGGNLPTGPADCYSQTRNALFRIEKCRLSTGFPGMTSGSSSMSRASAG
jgi:hypothetical protein